MSAVTRPPELQLEDPAAGDRHPAGDTVSSDLITLVLAAHHPLILNGLRHLFEHEQGCAVLATCADAAAALEAVRSRRPAILLIDAELPASGAVMVLGEIRRAQLPTQVVVLAAAPDDPQALDALRLGAQGVVLKEMSPEAVIRCVRRVHAREPWAERTAVEPALTKLLGQEMALRQLGRGLTRRETEVVRLAIRGVPTKEIAALLSVRQGTVKVHLHNIYDKLQVDGRLGLILFARRYGLV